MFNPSLTHSFSLHLLIVYCVPRIVLYAKDSEMDNAIKILELLFQGMGAGR